MEHILIEVDKLVAAEKKIGTYSPILAQCIMIESVGRLSVATITKGDIKKNIGYSIIHLYYLDALGKGIFKMVWGEYERYNYKEMEKEECMISIAIHLGEYLSDADENTLSELIDSFYNLALCCNTTIEECVEAAYQEVKDAKNGR